MSTNQPAPRPTGTAKVDFYNAIYGHFDEAIYHDVRRDTWGEDIGQNGWLTAREQDQFIEWLALGPNHSLLDIACGSGGPTLRIAHQTGAKATGVDIHKDGIDAANRQCVATMLSDRAAFQVVDAQSPLPFADNSFDALTCIDAINHLNDRPRVLSDWFRVLKPGGRLLYTDPVVVTGALTFDEIAIRASIGFFLFVAPETNDRMLASAGFQEIKRHDLTEALAQTAAAWHAARAKRSAELTRIESEATFTGQQRFLEVASRIAMERRLSRFAYLAAKPR
ncbi:MAG: class I SAM-dependent methyltransferase [Phycisphaerales bacterium]